MARILSEEQARQGMPSSVLSVIDADLRTTPLSAPLHTVAATIDHYVIKSSGFAAPISILRDNTPGLEGSIPTEADVIHLHGINGALSLNALIRASEGRKVVWTLHDMNPFTGGCHYSLGCDGFMDNCSSCPAVRAPFVGAIRNNLTAKIELLNKISDLSLVAPSTWLADQARKSAVFRGQDVTVIPNPVDPVYLVTDGESSPRERGLRAISIAKDLSDPVKAIGAAVSAFQEATAGLDNARLSLVGRGGEEFRGENIDHKGQLSAKELARELSHSDVLIVPSRAENAPLVIAEAAARGCVTLAADVGGMKDMITTLGHGATFSDREELRSLLREYLSRQMQVPADDRHRVGESAQATFSPQAIVARYGKVYEGRE